MSGSPLTTVLQTSEPSEPNRIPVDYDSAETVFDTGLVVESAAVLIGGSTAVAVVSKIPWLDVAMSLQGGLGAALGYGLGAYVQPLLSNGLPSANSKPAELAPIAGAIIVPLVASGGSIDKELGLLVIGGLIAASISKSKLKSA